MEAQRTAQHRLQERATVLFVVLALHAFYCDFSLLLLLLRACVAIFAAGLLLVQKNAEATNPRLARDLHFKPTTGFLVLILVPALFVHLTQSFGSSTALPDAPGPFFLPPVFGDALAWQRWWFGPDAGRSAMATGDAAQAALTTHAAANQALAARLNGAYLLPFTILADRAGLLWMLLLDVAVALVSLVMLAGDRTEWVEPVAWSPPHDADGAGLHGRSHSGADLSHHPESH